MRGQSIFDRNFKRNFNNNKYQNLTSCNSAQKFVGMKFFSILDTRFAKMACFVSVSYYCVSLYFYPEWFHELVGHWDVSPFTHNTIENKVSGELKDLNMLVIKRDHMEHKVEALISQLTDYQQS